MGPVERRRPTDYREAILKSLGELRDALPNRASFERPPSRPIITGDKNSPRGDEQIE